MWKQVQAAEVSHRRPAVSSKCFQLNYTCSDRLLAMALPPCPFHHFPSYRDVSQALSYFASTIVVTHARGCSLARNFIHMRGHSHSKHTAHERTVSLETLCTLWDTVAQNMTHTKGQSYLKHCRLVLCTRGLWAIALMMEAIHTYETSVYSSNSTRRYIPKDFHLYARRRENLKYRIISRCLPTKTSVGIAGIRTGHLPNAIQNVIAIIAFGMQLWGMLLSME
jgi:hypothetical protein